MDRPRRLKNSPLNYLHLLKVKLPIHFSLFTILDFWMVCAIKGFSCDGKIMLNKDFPG